MIEHGQRVCKLSLRAHGRGAGACSTAQRIGSHYQGQLDTLSKHFARPPRRPGGAEPAPLFDEPG